MSASQTPAELINIVSELLVNVLVEIRAESERRGLTIDELLDQAETTSGETTSRLEKLLDALRD